MPLDVKMDFTLNPPLRLVNYLSGTPVYIYIIYSSDNNED